MSLKPLTSLSNNLASVANKCKDQPVMNDKVCETKHYRIEDYTYHERQLEFLLIKASKILPDDSQAAYPTRGIAPWFFSYPNLFEGRIILVSHGQCWREGAWSSCSGNQDKEHFRRIGRSEDIRPHPTVIENNVWAELNCIMNETNFKRAFSDEPFIKRGWGLPGRNKL